MLSIFPLIWAKSTQLALNTNINWLGVIKFKRGGFVMFLLFEKELVGSIIRYTGGKALTSHYHLIPVHFQMSESHTISNQADTFSTQTDVSQVALDYAVCITNTPSYTFNSLSEAWLGKDPLSQPWWTCNKMTPSKWMPISLPTKQYEAAVLCGRPHTFHVCPPCSRSFRCQHAAL